MWLRYFFIWVLTLATSCVPPAVLRDGGALKTPAGAPYHWLASQFPIPVLVAEELPVEVKQYTYAAALIWNNIVGAEVFTVRETSMDFPMIALDLPMRGYIVVQQANLGRNGRGEIRGLAEVHTMPGEVGLRGQIHSVHMWYDGGKMSAIDQIAVGIHELGHCLGLAHDPGDPTSIMWYTANADSTIQAEDVKYVRGQLGIID